MWSGWSWDANESYSTVSTMSCQPTRRGSTSRPATTTPRLYARPDAIHDAFSGQYAAFAQDAIDNQKLVATGKLKMPVLAIGGDHSYGAHIATEIGFVAADVRTAVIKDSGHWIMEEQPEQAVSIILSFLETELWERWRTAAYAIPRRGKEEQDRRRAVSLVMEVWS